MNNAQAPSATAAPEGKSVLIHPGRAQGVLRAPPSKSYTHRAIVGALLGSRSSRIDSPLLSEDTRVSLHAAEALGATVKVAEKGETTSWTVDPPAHIAPRAVQIDCGESGTSLRLFAAAAALGQSEVTFVGHPGLARRPIGGLLDALRSLGAVIQGPPPGRSLPFTIRGSIHPGMVAVDATQSSQYVSALLLALATLPEASVIQLQGKAVSTPYISATLAYLTQEGCEVEEHENRLLLPGGTLDTRDRFEVPGDASSAAYLLALGSITGGEVTVEGIPERWPQADLAILDILSEAGTYLVRGPRDAVRVVGRPRPAGLGNFDRNLDDTPDLAPLLAALAAFSKGESWLRGGAHLAAKESDRHRGVMDLAVHLGASVRETPEGISLRGPIGASRLCLSALTDHRMFMSAAVAAVGLSEVSELGPANAPDKSYPGFLHDLEHLGIHVERGHGPPSS